MKTNLWITSALGALLLTAIYALLNALFNETQDLNSLLWGIIANYLLALLLGYYIQHSTLRGFKLGLSVFLIYFLIGHFNILIEAYIFNVTDRGQTLFELLRGFLAAAIFCPLFVYMFRKLESQETLKFAPRTFFGWFWKVLVANFLYLVFYIGAGLVLSIALPEMMEFYQDKIPPMDVMINTQLFLRGFVFIAVALLVLRTVNLSKLKKALLIGLIFAIIGGIAPLIQPNELMPLYIRIGHSFEVGISNFLYGLAIAYLLSRKMIRDDK
ncbi:MAG: hypothetical protein WBM98_08130 [Maribacter sp.]|uniref:hypothetical protein n=1 Tax=Maribacter sp. TaxID=1897614 RepID=UPI003C72D15F